MNSRVIIVSLFALAALLRLHNAWAALPLSGFDGPYHAAYIGIIHLDGRIPLSHESWSTYHPPLYYGLSALVWKLLPASVGPRGVLMALRLVNVLAGLAIGLAVFRSARLLFPDRPAVADYATAVALFLPMLVGQSSVIGNEVLTAALSAWALWLLLRCLAEPQSLGLLLGLGAIAGLAVLTKFNALAVLGAAGSVLLLRGFREEGRRLAALRAPALLACAAIAVSGGYFARNIYHYGVPLRLEVDISAEVMTRQGYGESRALGSYVSLRPDVLLDLADRSLRVRGAAVWPAIFGSVWFDLHGSQVSVQSLWGTRFARLLFLCGAVWTAFTLLGIAEFARRRPASSAPLGGTALALVASFALAGLIALSYEVATFSVLKGTLLSPGVAAFAIWAGLGCDIASRRGIAAARAVRGFVAFFIAAVVAIFWVGWLASTGVSPAVFYVKAFSDPPTRRVLEYFVYEKPLQSIEFYESL